MARGQKMTLCRQTIAEEWRRCANAVGTVRCDENVKMSCSFVPCCSLLNVLDYINLLLVHYCTMKLWKKTALIFPLLFALWLLTDNNDHKLAVFTALSRHPPSLRVYRALLELTLLLFCGALSLWLWERAVGKRVVGILLFQPPQDFAPIRGLYQAVPASEADAGTLPQDDNVLTEEEAQDACYASDGEVEEATPVHSEPPTAASVAHSASDLLLLVLVSLFLFTISSAEGGKYIEGMEEGTFQWIARIAAPIFPLVLFLLATFKSFFPFAERKDFWTVVAYTPSAPMYEVTFRCVFYMHVNACKSY